MILVCLFVVLLCGVYNIRGKCYLNTAFTSGGTDRYADVCVDIYYMSYLMYTHTHMPYTNQQSVCFLCHMWSSLYLSRNYINSAWLNGEYVHASVHFWFVHVYTVYNYVWRCFLGKSSEYVLYMETYIWRHVCIRSIKRTVRLENIWDAKRCVLFNVLCLVPKNYFKVSR